MTATESLKHKPRSINIDNGIKKNQIGHIVQVLSISLASTYLLYLKTQGCHWNVMGPHFYSLHKLFEEQYAQLADATDEFAERIRALGHPAPASFSQFERLSRVDDGSELKTAEEMIQQLMSDHMVIASFLKEAFAIAEEANDQGSCDLLAKRMAEHEKAAWMLQATLG